ncbi:hypothetical protein LEP1GSC008_0654 [Leptospira kirschneri serovar Bulgarica str. Nikolaevo]|uniref:Uncharacterized protein n=1 Tax=Leptospira kirschneri serovar Bulgarica str. Nikolaevo TaxID=1240687 RepID=M6F5X8_9LEPT|nr:hypothetical protein LEP1GSC008_0654 [Leptospira kirschneri serovar Bulgarica str. Nikolaevo]
MKPVGTTTFKKYKIFLNFENAGHFHLKFRQFLSDLSLRITEIYPKQPGNYYKNQIAK